MSVATDIASVRAQALLVWRGLTLAQRAALRLARPCSTATLAARGHARCLAALHRHGLLERAEWPAPLTTLAKLVREVGVAEDAIAARRRFSRRTRAT